MKPTKLPIALMVLTWNEEVNLRDCLESVKGWIDEIIIVDSPSTDKTLEIAREYTEKVFIHPFKNQADQWNWALDNINIQSEWLLKLDGDERMTPELLEELSKTLPGMDKQITGLFMKRRFYFLGRWIKYGGYYPTWLLRLARTKFCRSEERQMDEHLIVTQGRTMKLRNDFVHDDKKGISDWVEKHNRYASREVSAILEVDDVVLVAGKRNGNEAEKKRWLKNNVYYKMPIFFRVFALFLYRYIIQGGFLDGKEGLVYHFLQCFWFRFLIDAKLYEARLNQRRK